MPDLNTLTHEQLNGLTSDELHAMAVGSGTGGTTPSASLDTLTLEQLGSLTLDGLDTLAESGTSGGETPAATVDLTPVLEALAALTTQLSQLSAAVGTLSAATDGIAAAVAGIAPLATQLETLAAQTSVLTDRTGMIMTQLTAMETKIDTLTNQMNLVSTQTATIPTIAAEVSNHTLQLTAIRSQTDRLPDHPAGVGAAMTLTVAYDAAKTAASAEDVRDIDQAVTALETQLTAIAERTDRLPDRPAAKGDIPTVAAVQDGLAQSLDLELIYALLGHWSLSGNTLTATLADGSTVAYTLTRDGSGNITAITEA